MRADRLARIAGALAGGSAALERVLVVTTEMLGVTGASVSVIEHGEHRGALAVTGVGTAALDDLQFTLGQGPCVDADRGGGPMLEPDLATSASLWPAFAPAALDLGCRAAFAFPLRIGAIRVGILSLYRDRAGDLSAEDLGDAISITKVVTHLVLALHDGLSADELPQRLGEVLDHRRQVHQATGMIAAQMDVDTATALAQLRAWSWARGRAIDTVAEEVVRGALRFDTV